MNYKLSLVYAWCAYVLTILVTFSADYYIRIFGDDFYYSGLNEYYWITAIVFAVSIGGYFIIDSMKSINKGLHKIVYLVINIILGFIFYAISSYVYVVGFGIDSV